MVNPTRRPSSHLPTVWPRVLGRVANFITACIHAWSAHYHMNVSGRSFNADWRDQEK